MGAGRFRVWGAGKTPQDAFSALVRQAQHEHGHGGYTGTIAEKHSFKLLTPPPGVAALDFVRWVVAAEQCEGNDCPAEVPPEYLQAVMRAAGVSDDKYGPAAAVEIKDKELEALRAKYPRDFPVGERAFVFFGWAAQ
jgi:hypothetical protein